MKGDLGKDLIRLSKYHLPVTPYDAYTKVYKISIGDIKFRKRGKEKRKKQISRDNRWGNRTYIDLKWKGFIVSFLKKNLIHLRNLVHNNALN